MDHMEELESNEDVEAWDDVHGGELPLELVRESRREEVDFIEGRPVWDLRRVEECIAVTGKPPIKMRWVDTNKSHMRGKYD
eukprot:8310687-Karenia_brevis.AAC.1